MCLAVALAVLAGGCSNENGGALAGGSTACKPAPAPTASGEPAVPMPKQRPASLQRKDLTVGTGAAAAPGSTITVDFVGVACTTGATVDSTWRDGKPYVTQLAGGKVIAGWIGGLAGMRAGGRRLLVVPPNLGYGDTPPPGFGVQPGETLVFVVDLLAVS